MENDTRIVQIMPRQYTDKNGNINTEIVGLAENGKVYFWHRGSGAWILNVIGSN